MPVGARHARGDVSDVVFPAVRVALRPPTRPVLGLIVGLVAPAVPHPRDRVVGAGATRCVRIDGLVLVVAAAPLRTLGPWRPRPLVSIVAVVLRAPFAGWDGIARIPRRRPGTATALSRHLPRIVGRCGSAPAGPVGDRLVAVGLRRARMPRPRGGTPVRPCFAGRPAGGLLGCPGALAVGRPALARLLVGGLGLGRRRAAQERGQRRGQPSAPRWRGRLIGGGGGGGSGGGGA